MIDEEDDSQNITGKARIEGMPKDYKSLINAKDTGPDYDYTYTKADELAKRAARRVSAGMLDNFTKRPGKVSPKRSSKR
jgi:hypothetical protein